VNTIPTYRGGPIIEEPDSDDEFGVVGHGFSTADGAADLSTGLGGTARVEEIEVDPNAVAIVSSGPGPQIEYPGEISDRVAALCVFGQLGICSRKAPEIMLRISELRADKLSWREVKEIIEREVREKFKPEADAEQKREEEEQQERLRMIENPATRDSIIPRNSLEESAMRLELAKEKNC
jgi:hypothetical protein